MKPGAWRLPLQLAVTVICLVLLWRIIDAQALVDRLAAADLSWLAAAVGISVPVGVVAALRWRYTARQLGVEIRVGTAVREFYLALFLNQVLPGGLAGDAIRAWRHGRKHARTSDDGMGPAVRAVVIERIAGNLILGPAVAVSMVLWLALPGALPEARVWGPMFAAMAVLAAVAVGIVLWARWAGRGRGRGSSPGAVNTLLADSRRALFSRRTLGPQLVLALLVVGGCMAMFSCCTRAVGAPMSLFQICALVPPVLLAMAIPISFGGWGTREATAVALWSMAGLPGEEALAASIAYGLVNLFSSAPGAVALLFDRH